MIGTLTTRVLDALELGAQALARIADALETATNDTVASNDAVIAADESARQLLERITRRQQLRDAVLEAAKLRRAAIQRFEDYLRDDGSGIDDDRIEDLVRDHKQADDAIRKALDALEANERGGGT